MNKLGDHIPIKCIVDAKTDQEFKTYYIIYFNLVGSSRPNISLEQQIRKLNDFNDMIYQTINATVFYDSSHIFFPDYYSSTGDGAVFCFTNLPTHLNFLLCFIRNYIDITGLNLKVCVKSEVQD